MLGSARLITFALRAVVLILLISIVWIGLAHRYNEALVPLANAFLPNGISAKAAGTRLIFEGPNLVPAVSIDGLTLHFGLILTVVLVLAAVGLRIGPRLAWLLGLGVVAYLTNVLGVVLLARRLVWAAGSSSPAESGKIVFSLFAVFWGLIPAIIGGLWCFLYWIPSVSAMPKSAVGSPTFVAGEPSGRLTENEACSESRAHPR